MVVADSVLAQQDRFVILISVVLLLKLVFRMESVDLTRISVGVLAIVQKGKLVRILMEQ
jgi:hypothetical protein